MPRAAAQDGVFKRKDRKGYYITWNDHTGKRRKRKTAAQTLEQARMLLRAEKLKVDEAIARGYVPATEDSFSVIADAFLAHQKARVSAQEYEREASMVEQHFKSAFPDKISNNWKCDIDQYLTRRSAKVSPATVKREGTILKHIFSLAVEWEKIPVNPAQKVKLPRRSLLEGFATSSPQS